jgi:PKD domain
MARLVRLSEGKDSLARPIRIPTRLCRYLAALFLVVLVPATALAAGKDPSASFSFSPENPRAGDQLQFASSSCDPDGRLVRQAWDLDGDGEFDDAEGPVAGARFAGSGAHIVGLQVTDRDGASDVTRRTVIVNTPYALPRPDSARLMSPFPVVTLGGRLAGRGARIKLLSVRAPVCALVRVSCRGRGCPTKRASAYVGRKTLRLRRFERQLGRGTVLTVRVSKGDRIGKFTQFRIRSGLEPTRRDLCLKPGARAGSRCPRD